MKRIFLIATLLLGAGQAFGTVDDAIARAMEAIGTYVKQGYMDFGALRSIKPDVEAIWNETP